MLLLSVGLHERWSVFREGASRKDGAPEAEWRPETRDSVPLAEFGAQIGPGSSLRICDLPEMECRIWARVCGTLTFGPRWSSRGGGVLGEWRNSNEKVRSGRANWNCLAHSCLLGAQLFSLLPNFSRRARPTALRCPRIWPAAVGDCVRRKTAARSGPLLRPKAHRKAAN